VIKLWVALESSAPKALAEAAGDLCHEMNPISGSSHGGKLPPEKELLRLDSSTAVMSSVGYIEGGLLLRLYEAAGKKDSVTVTAPFDIKTAELVDLDGKSLAGLSPKGNAVSFEIGAGKVAGLRIKL
jgi:hypothetical protein